MSRDYVCVIGSLNYDIIMKQKRMPLLGETYAADSVTCAGGGKGANQAVQCAKLGMDTVMVGKVGNDDFGSRILDDLNRYGLDCSHIGKSERQTGLGIVHALENGEVYASIITGANYDFTEAEVDTLDQLIGGSRIVILQLEIPVRVVERVIRKAHERGVYTILNAAPAREVDREALRLADCLIVNETEASFYTGADIADGGRVRQYREQLKALTEGTVIVTLGSKGSVLLCGDEITDIAARPVEHAVESTGAGDSYIGAFAYGKFWGMKDGDACRFAAEVSAVTVTKIGAQEAMPGLRELDYIPILGE